MTRTRARLLLGLSLLGACALGLMVPACDTAPAVSEAVTRTSTITLARQDRVVVLSDVALLIESTLVGTNLTVKFEGTVTASTAEKAKEAARAFTILHVSDDEVVRVELRAPAGAQSLSGFATLTMPRGLALGVSSAGAVSIKGMERQIEVESGRDIIIEGARDTVRAVANGGSMLISSSVPASSTLDAQASGSIQLALPQAVSAEIQLVVSEVGQILIQHPGLPAPVNPNSKSYQTVVRGGAAVVQAVSQGGSIGVEAF